jgi:uncharacterized protein (TIGR00251 family)
MKKYLEIIKKYQKGALLNLFVTPGADRIVFPAGINLWKKCIEIKVKAPAKNNKANKDVIKTVADFFLKPISEVYIISGLKKREKTVFINNITIEFVSNKIKESINGL